MNEMDAELDNTPPMDIPADLPSNTDTRFKVDTMLWLFASLFTFYYFDVFNVIMYDTAVTGLFYNLAVASVGLSLGISLYFIVWCSYIKGIKEDDWEVHAPLGVPVATASAILSGICWNISLWSVYGIKTPVIIFVLFMGFIMMVAIIPSWSSAEPNAKLTLTNDKWQKAHTKRD